jgi:hypothetical protein
MNVSRVLAAEFGLDLCAQLVERAGKLGETFLLARGRAWARLRRPWHFARTSRNRFIFDGRSLHARSLSAESELSLTAAKN